MSSYLVHRIETDAEHRGASSATEVRRDARRRPPRRGRARRHARHRGDRGPSRRRRSVQLHRRRAAHRLAPAEIERDEDGFVRTGPDAGGLAPLEAQAAAVPARDEPAGRLRGRRRARRIGQARGLRRRRRRRWPCSSSTSTSRRCDADPCPRLRPRALARPRVCPGRRLVSAVPSADVTPWKPAGVSSPQFESHPAFDPLTGDFYFVRSSPSFEGWRILVAHCGPSGWSKPEPWPLAGRRVRGRSLVHRRRPHALVHLLAIHRRREAEGPRHLEGRAGRVRKMGRSGPAPCARQLDGRRVVSPPGEGGLAVLRLEPGRRPRQERHLAGRTKRTASGSSRTSARRSTRPATNTSRCRRPTARG